MTDAAVLASPCVPLGTVLRSWAHLALAEGAIEFPLIPPISTNALFAERGGRRVRSREYRTWRDAQMRAIMAAGRRRKVPGRVDVALFAPVGSKADTDNIAKAYIDAAVKMGLMDDDRNLGSVGLGWVNDIMGFGVIAACLDPVRG